jgi:hypothetical protein
MPLSGHFERFQSVLRFRRQGRKSSIRRINDQGRCAGKCSSLQPEGVVRADAPWSRRAIRISRRLRIQAEPLLIGKYGFACQIVWTLEWGGGGV